MTTFRAVPVKPARQPLDRALSWAAKHRVAVAAGAIALVIATAGIASLMIRQDVATTTTAAAGVIRFQPGPNFTVISAADFATLTVSSTGASASLGVKGVAGAASTVLGGVLSLNNTAPAQNYNVTLSRSAELNSSIQGFTVTVLDGATTLATWNAKTAAGSSTFTHVAGRVLNITVAMTIAETAPLGALGSFDMQFSIVPA